MPHDNGRSQRSHKRLYSDCCHAFTLSKYGEYREGIGTLRANGGDCGGGSEVLIVKYCIQDDPTPKHNGGAFATRFP